MMILSLYRRVLRWAFQRFYHEFAWTYDVVAAAVSWGYWPRWIEASVPFLHGEHVLELACGTGYLQRALVRQGIRSIGIDGSVYMLRHARRKLGRDGLSAPLVRVYAQALPFPDAMFSDVVATFPAEFILDPIVHAQAWRVLRPGGQIVIVDAGHFKQRTPYTATVDAAYRATGQVRHTDPRPALLQQAGFEVREHWIDVGDTRVQALVGSKS